MLAALGVHAARGLVGEEEGGLGDERTSDGDPLRLTARELRRGGAERSVEPGALKPDRGVAARLGPLFARQQQRERDVVQQREIGHELSELQDDPHPLAAQPRAGGLAEGVEVLPQQPDRPGLRTQDPRCDVQQRGLAAPTGPVTATTSSGPTSRPTPRSATVRR